MKILFLYCDKFGYDATIRTIETVEESKESNDIEGVQTAFIHVEAEDEENEASIFKKVVKQIKWITKKNNTNKLVIHSFAHLSESKGDINFTKAFLDKLTKKMQDSGFETTQTPFGHFLNLRMDAPGYSTARVFKSF